MMLPPSTQTQSYTDCQQFQQCDQLCSVKDTLLFSTKCITFTTSSSAEKPPLNHTKMMDLKASQRILKIQYFTGTWSSLHLCSISILYVTF